MIHRLNLSSNLSRDEATQRALKADGEMAYTFSYEYWTMRQGTASLWSAVVARPATLFGTVTCAGSLVFGKPFNLLFSIDETRQNNPVTVKRAFGTSQRCVECR